MVKMFWPRQTHAHAHAHAHAHTHVRLAEYVKCSTDDQIKFENKHEHNKPENVSLIHLARNFQKQVRIEDITQGNETATNTAQTITKKTK